MQQRINIYVLTLKLVQNILGPSAQIKDDSVTVDRITHARISHLRITTQSVLDAPVSGFSLISEFC